MITHTSAPARVAPSSVVPRVIVMTTVMLTFISFWRAAALVLNDIGSTAYYITGIAESQIGAAAPWFILLVMLFSYAVRWVYMESCSMFVRGGVYRIVKEAMGGTAAKLAVSALVFDFVLTGPISVISAGHYFHGLLSSLLGHFHMQMPFSADVTAITVALLVTAYFWRLNIRGVEEHSDKALKIMIITTIMVTILTVWSLVTIFARGAQPVPFAITVNPDAWGWLSHFPSLQTVGLAVFFVCLGHTLLAMSGEESLAQVYREIEAPKQKNLKRAANIIFMFCLVFTGWSAFAIFMLVPPAERAVAGENLLNAVVMNFIGPVALKLAMVAFVVLVGTLILAGAVNTSIFGSNAVLNRVAEDGILADWFRHPHARFGTTHRIITIVSLLQVITILVSRGDVTMLGEAYAFGVIWSFVFMSVSMLVLRFKYKGERTLKVPLNIRIARVEVPVGLGMICLVLICVAFTNLFTKKTATISGLIFTAVLFATFQFSEWNNRWRRNARGALASHREKFIVEKHAGLEAVSESMPPGDRRVLVPIRDPNNLSHLKHTLEHSHDHHTDVVVMTVKVDRNYRQGAEQRSPDEDARLMDEGGHFITDEEEQLFTRVVELAEKSGETVLPVVVPSNNAWYAIARIAQELEADEIVLGLSGKVPPDVQLEQLAMMWGMVATGSEKELTLRIVGSDGEEYVATL